MREMLFKNWKWLFENTNQTLPKDFLAKICQTFDNFAKDQFLFFFGLRNAKEHLKGP